MDRPDLDDGRGPAADDQGCGEVHLRWTLVLRALDSAGNVSGSSNSVTLVLDDCV